MLCPCCKKDYRVDEQEDYACIIVWGKCKECLAYEREYGKSNKKGMR
jgi:hypothetical protein